MQELVTINNGQPVTNSLLVAGKFEKQHKNVIASIKEIITSAENSANLFVESEYPDAYGRMQPIYVMGRDAFTLLTMGFTGEKAMRFKIDYINAFNKMESMLQSDEYILARSQEILQNKVKQLEARMYQQQEVLELHKQQLQESAPKVQYYNEVIDSAGFITINKIALDLGMSAIKLNRILCEKHIQYREGDSYMLYSKYRDKGYATLRPHPYIDSLGRQQTRQHLYWTEKGRQFIHELLKKVN